jgi:hypothetical protein
VGLGDDHAGLAHEVPALVARRRRGLHQIDLRLQQRPTVQQRLVLPAGDDPTN